MSPLGWPTLYVGAVLRQPEKMLVPPGGPSRTPNGVSRLHDTQSSVGICLPAVALAVACVAAPASFVAEVEEEGVPRVAAEDEVGAEECCAEDAEEECEEDMDGLDVVCERVDTASACVNGWRINAEVGAVGPLTASRLLADPLLSLLP